MNIPLKTKVTRKCFNDIINSSLNQSWNFVHFLNVFELKIFLIRNWTNDIELKRTYS